MQVNIPTVTEFPDKPVWSCLRIEVISCLALIQAFIEFITDQLRTDLGALSPSVAAVKVDVA